MRKILLSVSFTVVTSLTFGQTQTEMNIAAHKEYKKSEAEINSVYKKIMNDYKSDVAFTTNLRTSQRLWIQFRDAEMKVKFPDRGERYYGSVQPMCWSTHLAYLTENRIKELKVWLTGTVVGDVCAGSVREQE